MSTPTLLEHTPPAPARRRWVAVVVAALVAVGLVLGYSLWWSRPTAFEMGSGLSFTHARGTIDAQHPSVSTEADLPLGADAETVRIDHVRAVVEDNTADARITFQICRYRAGEEGFLTASRPAGTYCSAVTPADGHRLRLTRHTGIVMTVTPRHTGRVVVTGVAVTYTRDARHLWQHGTQTDHGRLVVPVTR